MTTIIKGGTVVCHGRAVAADIVIEGDSIADIVERAGDVAGDVAFQPRAGGVAESRTVASDCPHAGRLPESRTVASDRPSALPAKDISRTNDALGRKPKRPACGQKPTPPARGWKATSPATPPVVIDATGCLVLPGVVDSHVHFREPGLTHKATMASESRAAVAGGVTTVFDMPNCMPQTTTAAALADKQRRGAAAMLTNYAFFPGATTDNAEWLEQVDRTQVPGIKLFMGSSTGGMLVEDDAALRRVFAIAARRHMVVVAHCEDTAMINRNIALMKARLGTDDLDIRLFPQLRTAEACYASSSLAARLAREAGAHLHIAHVSTEQELALLGEGVTGEATPAHLLFTDADYERLGTRIKCNPAVKCHSDRTALRAALAGRLATVATDHAPHLLAEKQGGALRAMSGMPMVQFSLPAMLTLAGRIALPVERVAELMCQSPARLFGLQGRGELRPGYKADIAIVRRKQWTVTDDDVLSLCRWTPLADTTLQWQVAKTVVNGHLVYNEGDIDDSHMGQAALFK